MKLRFKKVFILFQILILCATNSFAISIVDTDKSAFITKAEFDIMKNNYQNQLDSYKASMEKKIDNAISSYLAGITVNKAPVDMLQSVNNALGGTCWFKNRWDNVGTSTITSEVKYDILRHYTYQSYKTPTWTGKLHPHGGDGGAVIFGVQLSWENGNSLGGRIAFTETTYTTGSYEGTSAGITSWSNWWFDGTAGKGTTEYNNVTTTNEDKTSGVGSAWIYGTAPNGVRYLKKYATAVYPVQNISLVAHTYLDKVAGYNGTNFKTIHVDEGGFKDTQTLATITIPPQAGWATVENGTKITSQSTTAVAQWYRIRQYLNIKEQADDFSIYMWGANADVEINALNELVFPIVSTSKIEVEASKTQTTFQTVRVPASGPTLTNNILSGQKFEYYPISISPVQMRGNEFANIYLTNYLGETVYLDSGIPIFETLDDGQEIKLVLKFKASTGASSVNYIITDGNCAGDHNVLVNKIVNTGVDDTVILECNKKGIYWLNCCATTEGVDAAIDTMSVRLNNN